MNGVQNFFLGSSTQCRLLEFFATAGVQKPRIFCKNNSLLYAKKNLDETSAVCAFDLKTAKIFT
jgi:hypothetical protein